MHTHTYTNPGVKWVPNGRNVFIFKSHPWSTFGVAKTGSESDQHEDKATFLVIIQKTLSLFTTITICNETLFIFTTCLLLMTQG